MSTKVKNDLLALLMLMKKKAADAAARNPKYEPVISTHRVIEILRGSGVPFSYSLLTQLRNDPQISPLIADMNRDQLTINLEPTNEPEAEPELATPPAEEPVAPEAEPIEPEQTGQAEPADTTKIDQMAKRALKRM